MVMTKVVRCVRWAVPAAVVALGLGGAVHADVVTGTSSAFTASGSLTAKIGPVTIGSYSFGPVDAISNSAPVPYNDSTPGNSFVYQVPNGSGGLVNVQIASPVNTVKSDVAVGSVSGTTSAESSLINGTSISILGGDILSLSLTSISQTAHVSGQTLVGSTTGGELSLVGLNLSVFGNSIISGLNLSDVNGNVNVNTGIAGLTLTLNEHITTNPAANSVGFEANAIHLHFNAVPYLGGVASITGDLYIGHTYAEQSYGPNAVPEPTSAALLGLGVLGAGLVGYRKRAAA